MNLTIPTDFASIEDDPSAGLWCCLGCKRVTAEPEDHHIARCPEAQGLLKQREHKYGDRRARHRED